MKKQFKIKLSLNKETVAKLNEEQMDLVAGGQGVTNDATVVIGLDAETDACGVKSGPSVIVGTKTCPPTGTCCCSV